MSLPEVLTCRRGHVSVRLRSDEPPDIYTRDDETPILVVPVECDECRGPTESCEIELPKNWIQRLPSTR
jgi:hypothetical protein